MHLTNTSHSPIEEISENLTTRDDWPLQFLVNYEKVDECIHLGLIVQCDTNLSLATHCYENINKASVYSVSQKSSPPP